MDKSYIPDAPAYAVIDGDKYSLDSLHPDEGRATSRRDYVKGVLRFPYKVKVAQVGGSSWGVYVQYVPRGRKM